MRMMPHGPSAREANLNIVSEALAIPHLVSYDRDELALVVHGESGTRIETQLRNALD